MTNAASELKEPTPLRAWRRFWYALGFRTKFPELPPDVELQMAGQVSTEIEIHMGWLDRLRILISGRALVRVDTRTEKPTGTAVSASSFEIHYPGQPGLRDRHDR